MIGLGLLALGTAGYVIASAAAPGRGLALRIALGFVLGQAAFLLHLNLLMKAGLGVSSSSWLALALVVTEAIGLRIASGERRGTLGVNAADFRLIGLAALPFLYALLWQLAHRDDDFFIHWPLISLFREGVFPPVNPFFPQLAYSGHYGRDLLGAGLSFFWPGDFQDLLVAQTALAQGALLILIFSIFGSSLGAASGALAVALAFLGVNASIRLGLLDTFQNNNALANILLFSGALVVSDPAAMRRVGGRLSAFLILTALALVYETHWVCLIGGATLALLPGLFKPTGRLRAQRVCAVLALSTIAALGQGGTLTNFLERRVADRHERSEDVVGLSQAVNVSFPKTTLSVTSRDGRDLPLFSAGFRAEAGPWTIWTPVLALFLALLRAPGPLTVALSGSLALLVPLLVDFGRYNSDVFRFIFLAAACGAACAGAVSAVPLRWLRAHPVPRAMLALALVALALSFGSTAIRRFGGIVKDALLLPEHYPWTTRVWALQRGNGPSLPGDLEIAEAVRRESGLQRLLPTWRDSRYARRAAVLSSFGGSFPLGFSLRPAVLAQESNIWPTSLVTEAFKATGDPALLSGIGATLVDVAPGTLSAEAEQRLLTDPRASLVERIETEGGARHLIRIRNRPPASPPGMGARVRSISLPDPLWPGEVAFAAVSLELPRPPRGPVRLGYRLFAEGSQVNPLDELDQDVVLGLQAPGVWTGVLTFVAPANPGRFEIRINQRFSDGSWDLVLAAGVRTPQARVREP